MSNYVSKITDKKIEVEKIINLLIDDKYNERLANCCSSIDEYTDKSYFPTYPCKVHFCPVCTYLKIRREYAISCQVYEKLMQLNPKPVLYFATLTIEECQGDKVTEAVKLIKDSFNRLIRIKRVKNVLRGSSLFIHFGMNKTMVTPHAHVVMALKPSFSGKQYINVNELQELWKSALQVSYYPHVKLNRIGEAGPENIENNKQDFAASSTYGINSITFDDIKDNSRVFNQIVDEVKGLRKVTHNSLIKELRKEVADDYAATKIQKVKVVSNKLNYKNKSYQIRSNSLLNQDYEIEIINPLENKLNLV